MAEQAREDGESERQSVIDRIGIQNLSHAKVCRLPSGVIVVNEHIDK